MTQRRFSEKELALLSVAESVPQDIADFFIELDDDDLPEDDFLCKVAAGVGERGGASTEPGDLSRIAPEHIVKLQKEVSRGFISEKHVEAYEEAKSAIKMIKEFAATFM
jgi:hypothetical protein